MTERTKKHCAECDEWLPVGDSCTYIKCPMRSSESSAALRRILAEALADGVSEDGK